jgi:hypothetical protein
MKECPFTQEAIRDPGRLVGRNQLLTKLSASLDRGNLLLFGGRRTGKTSILRCLAAQHQHDAGGKWWFWDAQKLGKGCGLRGAAEIYGSMNLEDEIKRHDRLVLIIDEFDILAESDRFEHYDFEELRALLSEYDHFSMIIATSTPMPEIEMAGSELLNTFSDVPMPPIECGTGDEFFDAVLKPVSTTDRPENWDALVVVSSRWAGLHPWLLQIAGGEMWGGVSERELADQLGSDLSRVRKHFVGIFSRKGFETKAFLFLAAGNVREDLRQYVAEYEALGLLAGEMVPGAVRLAGFDWLVEKASEAPSEGMDAFRERLDRMKDRRLSEIDRIHDLVGLLRYGLVTIKDGKVLDAGRLSEKGTADDC